MLRTATRRKEHSICKQLFYDVKKMHINQYEGDYVIVTKKDKYAFIKDQLERDLNI